MESLPDPCNDRAVKNCVPPPNRPLTEASIYPYKGKNCFRLCLNQVYLIPYNPNILKIGADAEKPDWKLMKDFLLREGPLKKE